MNTDEQLRDIKEYLSYRNYIYKPITKDAIDVVYNCYFNNTRLSDDTLIKHKDCSVIANYYGIYCYINKQYSLAKKYLLISSELGNVDAMSNLGNYYRHIEHDIDLTKKYWIKASELGHAIAMNNFATYCWKQENNIESMLKYYLMAIDLCHINSMVNLATYYYENNNFDMCLHYLHKAFDTESNIDTINRILNYDFNFNIIKDFICKGCHLYDKKCIQLFNKHLSEIFDITLAIETFTFLDDGNYNKAIKMLIEYSLLRERTSKINITLKQYCECIPEECKSMYDAVKSYLAIDNIDPSKLSNVLALMECVNCKQEHKCICLKCGHYVCIRCHQNNDHCSLCK